MVECVNARLVLLGHGTASFLDDPQVNILPELEYSKVL